MFLETLANIGDGMLNEVMFDNKSGKTNRKEKVVIKEHALTI